MEEESNPIEESARMIKERMVKLEEELTAMERKFDKKVKHHERKFSHKYLKTVVSTAYLKGKLSVLEEFSGATESSKTDLSYIG